ncbi:TPA: hypothetical protein ACXPQL_004119 [Salmonella enterica]
MNNLEIIILIAVLSGGAAKLNALLIGGVHLLFSVLAIVAVACVVVAVVAIVRREIKALMTPHTLKAGNAITSHTSKGAHK